MTVAPTAAVLDIAIIGSGMAGLAAGWLCQRAGHRVVLYEAQARRGMDAHTLRVDTPSGPGLVDVPLRVMSPHAWKSVLALCDALGVGTFATDTFAAFSWRDGETWLRNGATVVAGRRVPSLGSWRSVNRHSAAVGLGLLPLSGKIASNFNTFKQEALKIQGILDISQISQRPLQIENTTGGVEWEGKAPDTKPIFVQVAVGYDFVKTMQATIIAGRDFAEEMADSANYLINEQALRIIGYKEPVGMPLTFWGVKGTIIGVVKDFHFNSLHVPIERWYSG